jgi:SAM-dependent methyltransferase
VERLVDLERKKWTVFWDHRKRNPWGRFFDYLNLRIVFKDFAKVMAENSSKGLVLEGGSGFSESTLFLGKMRGDSVFALDISLEALKGAKRFANENAVSVNTTCADLRHIPFKKDAFDLVFSGGVIEHFENPVEIVKEMKRISKINIAVVPTNGLVWKLAKNIKKIIGEDKGISDLHYSFYDFKYATDVFKSSGYTVIKIKKFYTMLFCPYLAIIGVG